ncbi:hypothetical protein FA15DRAFT_508754 [Coprinopsis marcescibilis]|uniref:Transcription elongation factor Eaf N-terminal domain-containing protein n=1 Tax=Coprinopsis marcescibilis TaxID=230819 RepID=A0A5C3L7J0_COPMA|nr:hypothetical protein FA15DRAFT_508754 [Coprinopsis marcescibilis]
MATSSSGASTTSWMPAPGRYTVDVGQSLGRALKAQAVSKSSNASSSAPSPAPAMGKPKKTPDRDFYALKYNHKPQSIDANKPGMIQFTQSGSGVNVLVEHPSVVPGDSAMFRGQEAALNKLDCVLIYDEDAGTFTLEKLDAWVQLTLDRNLPPIIPRDASPTPSLSGARSTSAMAVAGQKRSHHVMEDTTLEEDLLDLVDHKAKVNGGSSKANGASANLNDDVDAAIANLVPESSVKGGKSSSHVRSNSKLQASAKTSSRKHIKEEDEEDEEDEDTPLWQQQQSQRLRLREQEQRLERQKQELEEQKVKQELEKARLEREQEKLTLERLEKDRLDRLEKQEREELRAALEKDRERETKLEREREQEKMRMEKEKMMMRDKEKQLPPTQERYFATSNSGKGKNGRPVKGIPKGKQAKAAPAVAPAAATPAALSLPSSASTSSSSTPLASTSRVASGIASLPPRPTKMAKRPVAVEDSPSLPAAAGSRLSGKGASKAAVSRAKATPAKPAPPSPPQSAGLALPGASTQAAIAPPPSVLMRGLQGSAGQKVNAAAPQAAPPPEMSDSEDEWDEVPTVDSNTAVGGLSSGLVMQEVDGDEEFGDPIFDEEMNEDEAEADADLEEDDGWEAQLEAEIGALEDDGDTDMMEVEVRPDGEDFDGPVSLNAYAGGGDGAAPEDSDFSSSDSEDSD